MLDPSMQTPPMQIDLTKIPPEEMPEIEEQVESFRRLLLSA
jgi:hypothetical protein